MKKYLMMAVMMMVLPLAHAHEGEHGPSTFASQKGGVVRSLESVHLELVSVGQGVKIYLFEKDGKPSDVTKYPSTATVTLPRKKSEPVALKPMKDHFEFQFDAKGAHRFTVELSILQDGHNDKVFTPRPCPVSFSKFCSCRFEFERSSSTVTSTQSDFEGVGI